MMKVAIPLIVLALVCVIALVLRRGKKPSEPRDGFVNVYDLQTKKTSTIPAAELAPGMVRVKLETGETVWAKVTDLKQGPLRHPPLEGEVRGFVEKIQKSLEEVYPHTYEFWEDGFRRDLNAEREIALWLHIARIHEEFAKSKPTSFSRERKLSNYWSLARMEQKKPRFKQFNFPLSVGVMLRNSLASSSQSVLTR